MPATQKGGVQLRVLAFGRHESAVHDEWRRVGYGEDEGQAAEGHALQTWIWAMLCQGVRCSKLGAP